MTAPLMTGARRLRRSQRLHLRRSALPRPRRATRRAIILQSAVADAEHDLQVRITLKKHTGETMLVVHKTDPSYLAWIVSKVRAARTDRACPPAPHLVCVAWVVFALHRIQALKVCLPGRKSISTHTSCLA